MNQSLDLGIMTNHRLPESTVHVPELLEFTEHNTKPITPNPYSPHQEGTMLLAYRVTIVDAHKTLISCTNMLSKCIK
jgi:hypothetical protein